MTLAMHPRLAGADADEAWKMYHELFAPLATRAVQRHLMTRAEFDEFVDDERITKMLILDKRKQRVGIGAITTVLEAVHLINPQYFEARYPAEYDKHAVFYVPFLGITRAGGFWALRELVAEVFRQADGVDGVVGMDMCNDNERFARVITTLTAGHSDGRSRSYLADAQSYWIHEMRDRTRFWFGEPR